MNIKDFYESITDSNNKKPENLMLLEQTHWFVSNCCFDSRTGQPLFQKLTDFLKNFQKYSEKSENQVFQDRLWRIAEHSRNAIKALILELKENPMRDHANLPIGKVKELDVSSFIKICNRPGRNIREKCAGKPYIEAPRHFLSHNLPENQLFKAYVKKLSDLLDLKAKSLNEKEDELVSIIRKWLYSDVADEISRWNNLPPNNTLLSHRHYRRILDSWYWLSSLEEDLDNDFKSLKEHLNNFYYWTELSKLVNYEDVYIAEIPIEFDYKNLTVLSWNNIPIEIFFDKAYSIEYNKSNALELLLKDLNSKASKKTGYDEEVITEEEIIEDPVCVDFTYPKAVFATKRINGIYDSNLIFQKWNSKNKSFSFVLENSNSIWLKDYTEYISSSDLFFSKATISFSKDIVAKRLISELKKKFKNQKMLWLVPDGINDFDLKELRMALNSEFTSAEPLPRSIAIVFEKIDFNSVSEDYSILVIDSIGNNLILTKIIIKFSNDLLKQNPKTKGFYLERQPSIVAEPTNHTSEYYINHEIKVFKNNKWVEGNSDSNDDDINVDELVKKFNLGHINKHYIVNKPPVRGGIRLLNLQKDADKIPYWRDCLPDLTTKIPLNGFYQHFVFVDKNTNITPKRDEITKIRINNNFVLPANKKMYEFQLYQGNGNTSLKFIAKLKSKYLSQSVDLNCKLDMEYKYGADNPYKLTFIPQNVNISPIVAEWEELKPKYIDTIPSLPPRKTWADFERFQKKDNPNETSNLLEWVEDKVSSLPLDLISILKELKIGRLKKIATDKKGKDYAFVSVNGYSSDVFCPNLYANCLQDFDPYNFIVGRQVFLTVEIQNDNRPIGRNIIFSDSITPEIEEKLLKNYSDNIALTLSSARFPLLTIWNNGHSLSEYECPDKFRQIMFKALNSAKKLLKNESISSKLRNELIYFLSCLHKDAPKELHEELVNVINSSNILKWNLSSVAFAIGDVSMPWQKETLQMIINIICKEKLKTEYFKLSLRILAISVWRNNSFILSINKEDLISICGKVAAFISRKSKTKELKVEKIFEVKKNENRLNIEITSALELILALITLRKSEDTELKELFMPGNKLTTNIIDSLDRLTELMVKNNISIFTRIELKLDKPESLSETPDLIYALRMYLSGDDGANSISISNINDSDE